MAKRVSGIVTFYQVKSARGKNAERQSVKYFSK